MQEAKISLTLGVEFVNLSERQIAGFWEKVSRGIPEECWEWKGYVCPVTGYGKYNPLNRPLTAHRVSYGLTFGDIPEGMVVMHKCDNRRCANPSHLSLGTHGDNVRDKCSKGRQSKGANHGWARNPDKIPRGDSHWMSRKKGNIRMGETSNLSKLTAEKVASIRGRYRGGCTLQQLADAHGVKVPCIWAIVKRISWKHVM